MASNEDEEVCANDCYCTLVDIDGPVSELMQGISVTDSHARLIQKLYDPCLKP